MLGSEAPSPGAPQQFTWLPARITRGAAPSGDIHCIFDADHSRCDEPTLGRAITELTTAVVGPTEGHARANHAGVISKPAAMGVGDSNGATSLSASESSLMTPLLSG